MAASPKKIRVGKLAMLPEEWEKSTGIPADLIRERIKNRWPAKRAVFEPTADLITKAIKEAKPILEDVCEPQETDSENGVGERTVRMIIHSKRIATKDE